MIKRFMDKKRLKKSTKGRVTSEEKDFVRFKLELL